MKSLLIKQAIVVPLAAMLIPIVIAFFLPGYSSISQHISEVELLDNPIALIQRIAAIVTGISILLFGLGVFRAAPMRLTFTTVTAVVAGISFASNGVFIMSSPLHGLYGLDAFSSILIPTFFAAEIQQTFDNRILRKLSLAVTVVGMLYIWLTVVGFNPMDFRGLTQRIFTIIYFGWFSVTAFWLTYRTIVPTTNEPASRDELGALG